MRRSGTVLASSLLTGTFATQSHNLRRIMAYTRESGLRRRVEAIDVKLGNALQRCVRRRHARFRGREPTRIARHIDLKKGLYSGGLGRYLKQLRSKG